MKTKKVKEYMTKDVLFFKESMSLMDALKELSERRVSGAPVINKAKKVIGMLSASDITKTLDIGTVKLHPITPGELGIVFSLLKTKAKLNSFMKKIRLTKAEKVKDIMSRDIISISPTTSIYEAATFMNTFDINRIPVVNNGKLKGIIARQDILKALF